MNPTPTPPPGLSVISAQQQRANELAKIAKTQIVFKIGGLTEENFAYAQQEIQAVVRQNPGDTDLFYIQRLIHASVSALGFQSNHILSNNLLLNSPTQSQLALRLLISELKKLSRDPFNAHKFTDALNAGLNSGGHAEDAFDLKTFVSKIGLVGLELVVLLHPLVSLPSLPSAGILPTGSLPPGLPPPPGHNPNVLAKKRQISKDAVQLLRESIGVALHSLSIPINSNSAAASNPSNGSNPSSSTAADEQMPELTAIQISKLLSTILSDTVLPSAESSSDQEPELLWTPTVQRATVQAIVSRVGQELTAQIANHCLSEARFSSDPSPISLLYRICSDPVICSADLCKTVLTKTNQGKGGEREVSDQLLELIELANKYGNEFQIDHVSWIRAIGEVYNNQIRWNEVIRLSFDHSTDKVTLPDGWGLRFLGKVLSLAPSLSVSLAEVTSTALPNSNQNRAGNLENNAQESGSLNRPLSVSSQSTVSSSASHRQNPLPNREQSTSTAAISSLFEKWNNQYTKVRLIDRLLYLPLDASPFLHSLKPNPLAPMNGASCKKVVSVEDVNNGSPTIRILTKSVEMSGWNVKELLCEIANLLSPQYSAREGESENEENSTKVVEKASDIMERACKANPELVMMALVQVDRPWAVLHSDLAGRLLQSFLTGHPSHQLVFLRIWQLDPDFLMTALREFYQENEMNVTRVLDITQDLKILEHVLNYQPSVHMVLDIASLASRREYLNLEKWLSDRITQQGSSFINGCLEFLSKKVKHDVARQSTSNQLPSPPAPTTLSLSAPTVSIFIRTIRINHELLSLEELERFKEARTQSIQLHPKLMNFMPGNEDEPGMQVSSFDSRIEAEVDSFYKKMYDLELSVDHIILILKSMRDSNDVKNHQFLACLLSGLFDEYKFFSTYPSKELNLTACLFGSLIREELIEYVPLGIGVRYVLDAIRNPIESKWYEFGSTALSKFATRLEEWPQLALAVSEVESLKLTHPEVYVRAKTVLNGESFEDVYLSTIVGDADEEADQAQNPQGIDDHNEEDPRLVFTSIKSDDDLILREIQRRKRLGFVDPSTGRDSGDGPSKRRLMTSKMEFMEPIEEISDKILFIVNNLAFNNLEIKLTEMATQIKPEHYNWFAKYLVNQRVSIEPNNHSLYLQFLEKLALPQMFKKINNETLIRCSIMLNSEHTLGSGTDRAILKNLGSWLGALTLAKDLPIKHHNIAFKDLLLQGFRSNRLIVAIPFVCKVLEQSSKSKVFKPPNPWLMGILKMLVELYHFGELKLNLKFEIEVLCKALEVELKDVKPTDALKKTGEVRKQINDENKTTPHTLALARKQLDQQQQQHKQSQQLQLQHQHQQQHISIESVIGRATGTLSSTALASSAPTPSTQAQDGSVTAAVPLSGNGASALSINGHGGYANSLQEFLKLALLELPLLMTFSSEVSLNSNLMWKRVVFTSIERAIRDIIGPVVERSVTIASISTREMILKDFAMEGKEDQMRASAHLMVKNLAGSLALVTTKEPLRNQILINIRTLSSQNGFPEHNVSDEEIQQVTADNLDVACQVIEKVATEKAISEIDSSLSTAYETRRRHREHTTSAFWDTSAMAASHYSGMLPNPLRLKLGGLEPEQLRVYEDFSNVRENINLSSPAVPQQQPTQQRAQHVWRLQQQQLQLQQLQQQQQQQQQLQQQQQAQQATQQQQSATPGIKAANDLSVSPTVADGAAALLATASGAHDDRLAVSITEAITRINTLAAEVERQVATMTADSLAEVEQEHEVRSLLNEILQILRQSSPMVKDQLTLSFAQKSVAMLYRSDSKLGRDLFVNLLEAICEMTPKVAHEVSQWLIYAEDERKYSVPVTLVLITHRVVPIAEFDAQSAKLILRDYKPSLMNYIAEFIEACLIESESTLVPIGLLKHSIAALQKAIQAGRATPKVTTIMSRIQDKLPALVAAKDLLPTLVKPVDDEAGLREQLSYCFAEWVRMYSSSYSIERPFIEFISSLQSHGILKGEEVSSLFFRVCMEVSIDAYIKAKAAGGNALRGIFQPVDAFARLISLMIKYHTDPTGVDVDRAKTHYMSKLLSIVLMVMGQFHKELGENFQQKPFFRFFSSLLVHINALESHLGSSYQSVMMTMSNLIHSMQPVNFPGFTTSWMALISHRLLMPKLLMFKDREGWSTVHRLLLGHLRFLQPFLVAKEMTDVGRTLYTGTVRIFLVLLHDFPTFLSVYHHSLCSALPPHCVQLSNLILAAFPLGVRLHDPFVPGFNLETLPDSRLSPTIISDFAVVLEQADVKQVLDKAITFESPQLALTSLKDRLASPSKISEGSSYDVPFLNSLVLYLGVKAIGSVEEDKPIYEPSCVSATIFKQLVSDINPEGRYLLLVAAIQQLRWTNSHTLWFSSLLIDTFLESQKEVVREQLARVFLERLLVQRPHPFGMIYGFIKFLGKCSELAEGLKVVEKSQELKALFSICRRHVVQ
ncbi:exoribonuclease [Phakopsora pachyrhizi]|uniref:General negative regulator of transcription subunit 1 n=1 Tax=Phakopsora pachyrhizi TaxID=170000 RepID=A0AAV0AJS5_PHAPC|nr:exoribonuclease [Phakopsora pachyrhizi]